MRNNITTCWYKEGFGSEWKTGFFHKWDTNWEDWGKGPGQYPVAIIEDATDSRVHVVFAEFVSFTNGRPDQPEEEPDQPEEEPDQPEEEPLYESSLAKAGREYIERAEKEGWIGEAIKTETRRSRMPQRFQPRLKWVNGYVNGYNYSRLLVQVHPDVIEVFNHSHQYVCQVRWNGHEMMYSQGGLPLKALEGMFMEAACEVAHQEGRSRPLQDFIDDLREKCDSGEMCDE